eukprot:CAMPEP_0172645902 /NCGR_PEP_ID=MMETSP1068-20121228/239970_1 /TAXON_ID=35684 /ORGANISM="Pseudopedinella elastica, Strain CCMP716" /LENGTH=67 /DNA_ID=CAMNT_0013460151 /DNA_START=290 /DNA_END=494 /DNA_ORIENTATION=-
MASQDAGAGEPAAESDLPPHEPVQPVHMEQPLSSRSVNLNLKPVETCMTSPDDLTPLLALDVFRVDP